MNGLGNQTKLVTPRFRVDVHRTLTENFDLENANTQDIEKVALYCTVHPADQVLEPVVTPNHM